MRLLLKRLEIPLFFAFKQAPEHHIISCFLSSEPAGKRIKKVFGTFSTASPPDCKKENSYFPPTIK